MAGIGGSVLATNPGIGGAGGAAPANARYLIDGANGLLPNSIDINSPSAGISLGSTTNRFVDLFLSGNATIAGKLTVGGLIDPTGVVLDEQATVPPAATVTTLSG